MIRRVVVGLLGFALLATAATAGAGGKGTKGPILVPDIKIVARPRAIVAIDVEKVAPKIISAEFREPFTTRVEAAMYKEPF